MKLFQTLSIFLGTTLVVAACSGGGGQRVNGRQCPKVFDPIVVKDIPDNQKVWKGGQNSDAIPNGTYTYDRAELLYTDSTSGLVIHARDVRQRDGSFKPEINCVRNAASVGMSPLSGDEFVPEKIVPQTNSKPKVDIKKLGFKVENQRLVAEAKHISKDNEGIEKVFEGKDFADYYMVNLGHGIYEVRSQRQDGTKTYKMSVRFLFAPAAVTLPAKGSLNPPALDAPVTEEHH